MKNQKRYYTFAMMCLLIALICTGCQKKKQVQSKEQDTKEYSTQVFAMDTYMTLKAYGTNAEKAVKSAKTEIERLDTLWSVGSSESEITNLNKKGSLKVSNETFEMIQTAKEVYKSSDGAFDITIYPLMELWGFTSGDYQVPKDSKIQEILKNHVGSEKIILNKKTKEVTLKDGAKIDLGGIAKGYTSWKVSKIFKKYGVKNAVVSLGGNVQAIGTKMDGSRWKVGIQSPDNPESGEVVGSYEAKDESVITSGGYQRYFEEGNKTYHHILDPATGKSSDSDLKSVTIISKNGTLADALSTTLFVLGKEKAIAYWKAHQDEFQMILIDNEKKIYISEGIQNHFQTEAKYEVVKK